MRLPASRTRIFMAARKQYERYYMKNAFTGLMLYLQKMKNVKTYYQEKLTRKAFLYVKHSSAQKLYLRKSLEQACGQKYSKKVSESWVAWKAHYIRHKNEMSTLKGLRDAKESTTIKRFWQMWQKRFHAIRREKGCNDVAVEHCSLFLQQKALQALVQNVAKSRKKQERLLKAHWFFYNNRTCIMFDKWKSVTAKKSKLRRLSSKRMRRIHTSVKEKFFDQWFELYSDQVVSREAFLRVQASKFFRWLHAIVELGNLRRQQAEELAEKQTKNRVLKMLKAWRAHTTQRACEHNKNNEKYMTFLASIERRCFYAFKKRVHKHRHLGEALSRWQQDRSTSLLTKCMQALHTMTQTKQRYYALSKKIASNHMRWTAFQVFSTLHRFVRKRLTLSQRSANYRNAKARVTASHYFKQMVIRFQEQTSLNAKALNYWSKRTSKKTFKALTDNKSKAEPVRTRVREAELVKYKKSLQVHFENWRAYLASQRRSRELSALARMHRRNKVYVKFFQSVRRKISSHSGYTNKVVELKKLMLRVFYERWTREFWFSRAAKDLRSSRDATIKRISFSHLKSLQVRRQHLLKLQENKKSSLLQNSWKKMRQLYLIKCRDSRKAETALTHYKTTLLTKTIVILINNCERKKRELHKIINLCKKRALHMKRVFWDILNIKRQKRYYTNMLIKQLHERLYHPKIRVYFTKFMEGIHLERTKTKMLHLAEQARKETLLYLGLQGLKLNIVQSQQNLAIARDFRGNVARGVLMKAFFCWKFTTRENQALQEKIELLQCGIQRQRAKQVFRRYSITPNLALISTLPRFTKFCQEKAEYRQYLTALLM